MSEQLSAWPTTDEMRATFGAHDRLAFDRWLAEVKAKAWDEGKKATHAALGGQFVWFAPDNPYRIESQETP